MTATFILQELIHEAKRNGKCVAHVTLPCWMYEEIMRDVKESLVCAASFWNVDYNSFLGVRILRGNSALLVEYC